MMDLFLTNMQLLASHGLEWCGLLWLFLSDSHFDGTHSLQSIHCWDTDAMLHFSKSDEDTNSSTSRMAINVIMTHELLYFSWAGFWGSSGSEPSMGDKSLYTSRNKSLIQQVRAARANTWRFLCCALWFLMQLALVFVGSWHYEVSLILSFQPHL